MLVGFADSLYLDLENPSDLEKLSDPRAYLVYSGAEPYPKGEGIEAIGVSDLAAELAGLEA